ncbi:hypothetical protein VTJ49DRAFT_5599 [Mycothermus thermophilus]|uniref:Transcription initiation factor TFIID subunit 4 n=1 Tax=Humicola insolens TaxID=85995 RepID=A0ABR3VKA7_HUMIN
MAQPQPQVPQAHHQNMQQMQQMQQQMQHMQQMQQQMPQMQQRPTFSQPQQHATAPQGLQQQSAFSMPPNKRPRTTPTSPPPATQSSYAATPYAASPQLASASPAATASPNYTNLAAPAAQYNTMTYTNGASPAHSPAPAHAHAPVQTPTQPPTQAPTPVNPPSAAPSPAPSPAPLLSLPETRPAQPASPVPLSLPSTSQQFTTAIMAPIGPLPPSTPGSMAPPLKPPAKEMPAKEIEYDVEDTLAGTGIDLRAEEQALADFYAGSFSQDARTGLPANGVGSKGSFYGAGMANQPGEPVAALSQEAYEAEAAQRAWEEAAQRLAVTRSNEINNPFLIIPNLHHRIEKIAREHGLGLNLDMKNPNPAGKMRPPQEFPPPKVTVSTKPGPDGTMVVTTGSFIPHDAYLVDQLALLSIATKHRLRELIEDAQIISVHRQKTSHGDYPPEWADVAVPLRTGLDSLPETDATDGNPRKRSYDAYASQTTSQKSGKHGPKNLMEAVREVARVDRDVEEARLRKRQKRLNPEVPPAGSRAGSAAPGGPKDGAAPETETAAKAPTKKELKKSSKLAEASSTASTNQTLSTLMGGFGRRKGKTYTWMQQGGAGSTPGTPKAAAAGDAGAAAADGGAQKAPEKTTLTADPRYPRLGTWREDKEKGKGIQLRDWVTALEMDGIEVRAIQDAYLRLDSSGPKDRS